MSDKQKYEDEPEMNKPSLWYFKRKNETQNRYKILFDVTIKI